MRWIDLYLGIFVLQIFYWTHIPTLWIVRIDIFAILLIVILQSELDFVSKNWFYCFFVFLFSFIYLVLVLDCLLLWHHITFMLCWAEKSGNYVIKDIDARNSRRGTLSYTKYTLYRVLAEGASIKHVENFGHT